MNREDAHATRGLILRGVLHAVSDESETQRLDVETHEGVVRSGVEVLHPYGLVSVPPAGALTVVLAVGGDQGDLVALPAASPSGRMGGLPAGAVGLADDAGNRVLILPDGKIEVQAAAEVVVTVSGTVFRVVPEGVFITGNLTVSGQVVDANGSMQEMRDRYNGHSHGGGSGPAPVMD